MKGLEYMEQYLELAAGIVERAIKDYIQEGWWINNHPAPETHTGKYACEYINKFNIYCEAKNWMNNKTGFVQEIFNGNDVAVKYLADECEKVTHIGPKVLVEVIDKKTGQVKVDKDGNKVTKEKNVDKIILYKYILPLVNSARIAIGLEKINKID